METIKTIGVTELDGKVVVDVRTPAEWSEGHIKEARHIELATLAQRMDEIPKDCDVALICRSGGRSATAAAFLQRAGYSNVYNVLGGMEAWKVAGLPIEK